MDQLLVDRPGWLDWAWVLRVLDQEVRVTGEEVRPADGMVATACLVADEPLVVTVTGGEGHLAVTPAASGLGEFVTRQFHLDLDGNAVDTALGKSTLARLFEQGWLGAAPRRSHALVVLPGLPVRRGTQTRPVRRMFAELGRPAGRLRLRPDPADVLTAGDHRIVSYGVAPHRAANVVGLARAFAARPDRYDEVTLQGLPGDEAIARVAELPHIGPTRARVISSTALGHDDVLPDLARQDEGLRDRLGLGWSADTGDRAPRRALPQHSG